MGELEKLYRPTVEYLQNEQPRLKKFVDSCAWPKLSVNFLSLYPVFGLADDMLENMSPKLYEAYKQMRFNISLAEHSRSNGKDITISYNNDIPGAFTDLCHELAHNMATCGAASSMAWKELLPRSAEFVAKNHLAQEGINTNRPEETVFRSILRDQNRASSILKAGENFYFNHGDFEDIMPGLYPHYLGSIGSIPLSKCIASKKTTLDQSFGPFNVGPLDQMAELGITSDYMLETTKEFVDEYCK